MMDEQFESLLREHLPFLPQQSKLSADTNLRDFGLDSMGAVALLAKLERQYDVRFVNDSLNMENFSTPARLWSTVSSLS